MVGPRRHLLLGLLKKYFPLMVYMQQKGICHHHRIAPLHPKANCTAESIMCNLNKVMRIASIEGQPWGEALYAFLLNYRIAKHVSTDVSPAEALFHRKIRGKVPDINHRVNIKALQNVQTRYLHTTTGKSRRLCWLYNNQSRTSRLVITNLLLTRVTKQKGTMITAGRPFS